MKSRKPTTLIALRHGGTHLIQPIIRHMTGTPVAAPKGDTALSFEPSDKVVVFLRDPRNRLISNFRYKRGLKRDPASADAALAAFLIRSKGGSAPIAHMQAWANRWIDWPGSITVRFEDLIVRAQGIAEAERLKAYLDAPGEAEAAYEYTFGKSDTWTGRHSDWREWFGPLTTAAWDANGGARLLKTMGYE